MHGEADWDRVVPGCVGKAGQGMIIGQGKAVCLSGIGVRDQPTNQGVRDKTLSMEREFSMDFRSEVYITVNVRSFITF